MGGRVIVAGVVGLLVGLVAGATATWGLDPADEPGPEHADDGETSFVVFVQPELPDAEVAALETELRDDPRIRQLDYLDPDETRAERRRVFADDEVDPDLLPTSFRFTLSTAVESAVVDTLTDVSQIDGVDTVTATLQTQAVLQPGGPIRWNG